MLTHSILVRSVTPKNPRRFSRRFKILPHELFSCEYTLWLDGSLQLLQVPPLSLLDGADLAVFRHRTRNCAYDEADVCSAALLDRPWRIASQMDRYRKEGYPSKAGLVESGFLFRRMSADMRAFDEEWWAEYDRGSCRDQLSFGYVARKMGMKITYLDGNIAENDYVRLLPHRTNPR